MTPHERIRAALGKRFGQLLTEDPRREAWLRLPEETLQSVFREAQRQAAGGQAGASFATLLIRHLDHRIGIEPEAPLAIEPEATDTLDAHGRIHRPDHDFAARERSRREREERAEEAYAQAYDEALDAGLDDAAAHARAAAVRADVLSGDG